MYHFFIHIIGWRLSVSINDMLCYVMLSLSLAGQRRRFLLKKPRGACNRQAAGQRMLAPFCSAYGWLITRIEAICILSHFIISYFRAFISTIVPFLVLNPNCTISILLASPSRVFQTYVQSLTACSNSFKCCIIHTPLGLLSL